MSRDDDRLESLQQLSSLMDGEGDPGAAVRACGLWRDDAAARATWHRWHLIGDVLRSDDLASDARRDAAFLLALRARMASEPVVFAPPAEPVAPEAAVAARRRWRRWSGAAAVAAGFVVVAGAVMVMNSVAPPDGSAPALAQSTPAAGVVPVVATKGATGSAAAAAGAAIPAEPEFIVVNGEVIRDARLDRYLAAHRPHGAGAAAVMPSSFERNGARGASNR